MAALPDDYWLLSSRRQPAQMTAAEYEALPEDISKMIEVVDGYVVFCESPTRRYQRAGRRLANLIERHAQSAMRRGHECVEVDTDIDLRLCDVPLCNRQPDVVLHCSNTRTAPAPWPGWRGSSRPPGRALEALRRQRVRPRADALAAWSRGYQVGQRVHDARTIESQVIGE